MQAGRYEEALPLLEQAVAGLAGSGELAEAYASYNLAYTRRALGQCDGVVDLLNRSEQVQGERRRSASCARKPSGAASGVGAGEARRVLALVVLTVTAGALDRLPPVAVGAVPRGSEREALGERGRGAQPSSVRAFVVSRE